MLYVETMILPSVRLVARSVLARKKRQSREWHRQNKGQVGLQVGMQVDVHHVQVRCDDQQAGTRQGATDQNPDAQGPHYSPRTGVQFGRLGIDEVLSNEQLVLAA